jgi:hypothetical protein
MNLCWRDVDYLLFIDVGQGATGDGRRCRDLGTSPGELFKYVIGMPLASGYWILVQAALDPLHLELASRQKGSQLFTGPILSPCEVQYQCFQSISYHAGARIDIG